MKTDDRMVAKEESVEGVGSCLMWGFICNGDRVSVPTREGFERRTCVCVVLTVCCLVPLTCQLKMLEMVDFM